jgi:hypothetical protein
MWSVALVFCCAGAGAQAQAQAQVPMPMPMPMQPPAAAQARPAAGPFPDPAVAPAYVGQRDSSPQELQAITRLTEDFQAAIAAKNSRALSALMFSANIVFVSPATDAVAQRVRDSNDVTFDGIGGPGLGGFLRFIATSPQSLQEKFYNVHIVQDGNVASVDFDYDFLIDGRSENHGLESWQLYKTEGSWKILSVLWSTHAAVGQAGTQPGTQP